MEPKSSHGCLLAIFPSSPLSVPLLIQVLHHLTLSPDPFVTSATITSFQQYGLQKPFSLLTMCICAEYPSKPSRVRVPPHSQRVLSCPSVWAHPLFCLRLCCILTLAAYFHPVNICWHVYHPFWTLNSLGVKCRHLSCIP